MPLRLLRDSDSVQRYLPEIVASADQNRKALGFLPPVVYEESALLHHLWVVTNPSDTYIGHLLFGGRYPTIKVFQVYVQPSSRRLGVASFLIEELVRYGETADYLTITARVASDLTIASAFWEHHRFATIKEIAGGRTSKRTLRLLVRHLDVPALFHPVAPNKWVSPERSMIPGLPLLRTASIAIDTNSILDLTQHRSRYPESSALLHAALTHEISLYVTFEVENELLRHSSANANPALELVRQLPSLPVVDPASLAPLMNRLRALIFPTRHPDRKDAHQDTSDLTHIATCIHHGLTGFVTSDRALLRAGHALRTSFGLEIIPPHEFSRHIDDSLPTVFADIDGRALSIRNYLERERADVDEFLRRMGLTAEQGKTAWRPGARNTSRRRVCAWERGRLIGVAAWDTPGRFVGDVEFHCYVNEASCAAERIVDHFLELVHREARASHAYRIQLHLGTSQFLTRSTAVNRGFRTTSSATGSPGPLVKVSVPVAVGPQDWSQLSRDLTQLVGLQLQPVMPSFSEVRDLGLEVTHASSGRVTRVNYFDFETFVAPGLLLYPGRRGLVIPIRQRYAADLLGGVRQQMTFLPSPEALLRIEKAYFRSPRDEGSFQRGMPIVFYVSGHGYGSMEAVGYARITSSTVLPLSEARLRYRRQGVLTDAELEGIAQRHGHLHVFTFDNFAAFATRIPFARLKELGCASRGNLATVQAIEHSRLVELIAHGK